MRDNSAQHFIATAAGCVQSSWNQKNANADQMGQRDHEQFDGVSLEVDRRQVGSGAVSAFGCGKVVGHAAGREKARTVSSNGIGTRAPRLVGGHEVQGATSVQELSLEVWTLDQREGE